MKKYKLQDLVANGSHSRLKVDSDLLVGDINNGYGYGDVLDANATKDVATGIAEDKANTVKQELLQIISEVSGGTSQNYAEVLAQLEELQAKNDEQDEELTLQIQNLITQIQKVSPSVGGSNDNLIFNFQ